MSEPRRESDLENKIDRLHEITMAGFQNAVQALGHQAQSTAILRNDVDALRKDMDSVRESLETSTSRADIAVLQELVRRHEDYITKQPATFLVAMGAVLLALVSLIGQAVLFALSKGHG